MLRIKFGFIAAVLVALITTLPAVAHDNHATYLGNEGVMVQRGEAKILFDPLYNQNFGAYLLVPQDIRDALMAGKAPYDNIDIVFISHAHGDHFAPAPMLAFMHAHENTRLVASQQAVDALKAIAGDEDASLFARITPLTLNPKDAPISFNIGGVAIEAVRIPHAGGPRQGNIQNYVYRVALDDQTRVMHFGDADPAEKFFGPLHSFWQTKRTRLAMLPYWFFDSEEGHKIMDEHLNADHYIGVHVPTDSKAFQQKHPEADLFTNPGETRPLD